MTYELVSKKKDSFERELPIAEVKQVFKGRAQQVDNHRIVVTFGTEPAHERNANATGESFVDFGFILKLGMLGLHRLQFDGHFLTWYNVDPMEYTPTS